MSCPLCGTTVFQHGMIPILADDGTGLRYVCQPCSRQFLDANATAVN